MRKKLYEKKRETNNAVGVKHLKECLIIQQYYNKKWSLGGISIYHRTYVFNSSIVNCDIFYHILPIKINWEIKNTTAVVSKLLENIKKMSPL